MNKEDRLYKLSKGSDTAMWAHEEIVNQDNHIVELKEYIQKLQEDVAALEIRDLEQQAKGVDWVLACRGLNLSEGEVHTLMDKCNELHNQAKALNEGE